MDEDENNINLLPDALKGEEEKSRSAKNGEIPVKFHFPQEQVKPRAPVVLPITSLPPQETVKKSVPPPEVKQLQPRIKKSTKIGFFTRLFSGLKSKKVAYGQKKKLIKPGSFVEPASPVLSPILGRNSLSKVRDLPRVNRGVKEPVTATEPQADLMDVNLIPAGVYLLPNKKIFTSFGLTVLNGLIVIFFVYLSLVLYQYYLKGQSEKLIQELEQGAGISQQYQSLETATQELSDKLESIQVLLDRHVYWTKVFSALERLTIADVYYKTISANTNGSITLAAVAPNYTAVARQYLVFQQAPEMIERVQITSASGEVLTGEVNFNIVLQLKPDFIFVTRNP